MKRVLCLMLSLMLLVGLVPMQAMAETSDVHSITVNVVGSGTASASPATASAGESVTINWEPGDGLELKEITGMGPEGSFQIYPYDDEFIMPDGDVTVTVKFGPIGDSEDIGSAVYCVYLHNGNYLDEVYEMVNPGSYQLVPLDGYTIDRVEAMNGVTEAPVDVSNSWCVEVPENGTIVAYIYLTQGGGTGDESQPTEYNITVTTPVNGTVSDVPAKAKKDDVITIKTTPAEGYELDKITVTCGSETIDVDDEGKFAMPEGDVTVTVTFKTVQVAPTEYNITVTDPENGRVTISDTDNKAKADDEIAITTTANDGYELDEITVTCNGAEVPVTDGKFTMPAGDVTVTVTFKREQTSSSGLTFEKAYDVQRYPVYPKKGDTFEVWTFSYPFGSNGSRVDSNEGPWTLSSAGKYSAFNNPSSNLTGLVTGVAREYKLPAGDIPIHKLTRDGAFIAYGVLVMHNPTEQVAFFIGDSLSGSGAGYFFSQEVQSGTQYYDVPKDITDNVKPSASHTTNPDDNAYKANIDLTDQAVVDMLVTEEDMASGKNVQVYMEVKELTTSAVPSGDYTAITSKAGSKKIAAFLDIQLWKKIDTNQPTPIHNTGNNAVPITMKLTDAVIPSNAGKDSFSIIYHHIENGTTITEEIPATFDVSSKTLTFQASKFSTYALVWKDKAPSGTLDKAVKAGDISGLDAMPLLLLFCAVALAGVAVYDKKRAR